MFIHYYFLVLAMELWVDRKGELAPEKPSERAYEFDDPHRLPRRVTDLKGYKLKRNRRLIEKN